MADLTITAASVLASANAIIERRYNFGATVTQGQAVYLDANTEWQLLDADAAATGNGVSNVRGIALVSGADGQPAIVALKDDDFTPGATLTVGASYYASGTAGGIAPAADLASGDYVVFLGVAKSTTKLNLNPTAAGAQVPV